MLANEFVIEMDDRPGELARVCEMLGTNEVNLKAIATDRVGSQRFVRIIVDNDKKTAELLDEADVMYTQNQVVVKTIPDTPNSLTQIARKLGKAKVNIEAIYLLSRNGKTVNMVFALDNAQRGAEALKG